MSRAQPAARRGLRRMLDLLSERGTAATLAAALRELRRRVQSSYLYFRLFKSQACFRFEGRDYRYFYHRYNGTWRGERAVEVPIVWEIVRQHRGRRILEVGNVLAHYFPVTHERVDKYERAEGVRSVDVVDFRPGREYDLIVSISTLEHVGFDEEPRDPDKLLRALDSLKSLLAPGGRLVVTHPLAYNPQADAHLRAGRLAFTRCHYLMRISEDNRWRAASWEEVQDARFNHPFRRINALVIGIYERPAC